EGATDGEIGRGKERVTVADVGALWAMGLATGLLAGRQLLGGFGWLDALAPGSIAGRPVAAHIIARAVVARRLQALVLVGVAELPLGAIGIGVTWDHRGGARARNGVAILAVGAVGVGATAIAAGRTGDVFAVCNPRRRVRWRPGVRAVLGAAENRASRDHR